MCNYISESFNEFQMSNYTILSTCQFCIVSLDVLIWIYSYYTRTCLLVTSSQMVLKKYKTRSDS